MPSTLGASRRRLSNTERSKQIEVEALADIAPMLGVVAAWRKFKRTHDVADAKLCCCEHTVALFAKLDALEKQILEL